MWNKAFPTFLVILFLVYYMTFVFATFIIFLLQLLPHHHSHSLSRVASKLPKWQSSWRNLQIAMEELCKSNRLFQSFSCNKLRWQCQ